MGARLWHHLAPWLPEPSDALHALQAKFLADTYDLPSLVKQELANMRDAVRETEAKHDPYELLDMYRRKLGIIEDVIVSGLPDDSLHRIELLRKLAMDSGEGIGNVLDVETVSTARKPQCAQKLVDNEAVLKWTGSLKPTLKQAGESVFKINEELCRGEAVCFPVYSDDSEPIPVGWYFVGNTSD